MSSIGPTYESQVHPDLAHQHLQAQQQQDPSQAHAQLHRQPDLSGSLQNPLKRGASAASLSEDPEDNNDDDGSDEDGKPGKKSGRRKIKIEYIDDKSRRHITFSKRKAGIMKKAYELSTLTGTQVLLLVASETGHVYTFATPKLQPLITKPEGKNLIQACLNAPDPNAQQQQQQQQQQVVYAPSYAPHPYSPMPDGSGNRLQGAYEVPQQNGESAEMYQDKQAQVANAANLQQYAMQSNVGALQGYPAGYAVPMGSGVGNSGGPIGPYVYSYPQLSGNPQGYGGMVGTAAQQQQQLQQQQQQQAQAQAQQQQQSHQQQQHQQHHAQSHHPQPHPSQQSQQSSQTQPQPSGSTQQQQQQQHHQPQQQTFSNQPSGQNSTQSAGNGQEKE
ncbi:uncharacterized protein SPPG_06208 [Spizellomyces punctatus DAOM BR117]|uniref:MADS-box domain-containing protein n=1 Tax=Spizellomyces punctatus (strain DAOM BR117) TaxID=645134 RepID=A0A0L0HC49_SPIPD|nr:hypothetical protein, variant [Spizellomyces punctatus DAOM BR117]XP_016606552.1 uncharacterized protein SPPG_06208 [Spizellomyces punctatus DAOM BR117]KNC98511.1 hypothetical protein, variant [Spizellomyces punctatus DAOM BR117]KNC98512.1 hypothetical protein SPPG_06208 [Spizellomyces punctatus DAOM BR117]|eukprot:XP_016606551.1 hypothetical protein, variant [Spizellomyces punctatus DAOM BR117]